MPGQQHAAMAVDLGNLTGGGLDPMMLGMDPMMGAGMDPMMGAGMGAAACLPNQCCTHGAMHCTAPGMMGDPAMAGLQQQQFMTGLQVTQRSVRILHSL